MRRRAAVVAVLGAIAAAVALSGGGGAGPGTANLWVDTNGGTCTRQSSAGAYSDAGACSSAQAAYTAASCGDTVRVTAATSYTKGTHFTISTGTKSCTTGTRIVFRPENDTANTRHTQSSVVTSGINIAKADCWCEFWDFDTYTGAASTVNSAGDVAADADVGETQPPKSVRAVFRRVDTERVWIQANEVQWVAGSAGGFDPCADAFSDDAMQIYRSGTLPTSPPTAPDNVLVDGAYFYEIDAGDTLGRCSAHADAIQILDGTNITIRNNTVRDGPDEDFIARPFEDELTNVLFENNQFSNTKGTQNIIAGSGTDVCSNIVIRNNSASEQINIDCDGAGSSGNRHYNNIAAGCNISGVGSTTTATNNVDDPAIAGGTGCGTSPRSCSPSYVDASHATTGDKRLATGDTCAKNFGHATDFPATDIIGTSRPQGGTSDIGAHEVIG